MVIKKRLIASWINTKTNSKKTGRWKSNAWKKTGSREHPLTQVCITAYGDVFGYTSEKFEYWDFSKNAVALIRLGIPTIGFGPGEHKLAHMRNEKCAIQEIVDTCAFCGGDWEDLGELIK